MQAWGTQDRATTRARVARALAGMCLALASLLVAAVVAAAPGADPAPAPAAVAAATPAAARLVLDGAGRRVDAWPAVTMLVDPAGDLDVAGALARRAQFAPPATPRANLGVRRDAVWLRVPLEVRAGGAGDWIVRLDYPPLNEVRLVHLRGGEVVSELVLGSAQAYERRPLGGRSHAAPIELAEGGDDELLLRVSTSSSMVVPIALMRADAFHADESRMQLAQGVFLGVVLALVGYSLAHWISLRERLFLLYAVAICGQMTFFVAFTGLGQQHLWSDQSAGVLSKLAPLGVLLGMVSMTQFVMGATDSRRRCPRLHRAFGAAALAALAALLAGASGLLDYRATQTCATLLGPTVLAFGLATIAVHARSGDEAGRWMLAGWLAELAGALALAALLRGRLPADGTTMHLFQLGVAAEMLFWLRVLGLRVAVIQRSARRIASEKQAFESLAQTDALTGLPNRRGLLAALDLALAADADARPDGAVGACRRAAVYLLDLDGFKPVNDRHGHDVGDALLVAVGQRLQSLVRRGDVVARLGGDEFVVVAAAVAPHEAAALGRALLDAFAAPFAAAGVACSVGTTIGYALCGEDGDDAATLLKRADEALYAGKRGGGGEVRRHGEATPAAARTDPRPAHAHGSVASRAAATADEPVGA